MFGYLPAPCSACQEDAHSVYRSFFCGLSSTLAREYGPSARWLTNRDGAFVSILGASFAADGVSSRLGTCCNPLGRKRELRDDGDHARFAAAVTVCGVYTKLQDDWEDESGIRKYLGGLGHSMLRSSAYKAIEYLDGLGFPTRSVRLGLEGQSSREAKSDDGDWRACAESTAAAYGAVFEQAALLGGPGEVNRLHSNSVRESGMSLGRIVYLLDAFEDRAGDSRSGRFNPLLNIGTGTIWNWFADEFEKLSLHFDRFDPGSFSGLARSILIEGLESKGTTILGMSGVGEKRKKSGSRRRDSWWDRCDCCGDCSCCCDGLECCGKGAGRKGGSLDCDCCPCDCS